MGHYYSEMRSLTLSEKLAQFINDNHDETFTLTPAKADGIFNALSISRRDLQALLSTRHNAQQDLSEIRAMFHRLSR